MIVPTFSLPRKSKNRRPSLYRPTGAPKLIPYGYVQSWFTMISLGNRVWLVGSRLPVSRNESPMPNKCLKGPPAAPGTYQIYGQCYQHVNIDLESADLN
jgi:hypothetical protein